MNLMSLSNTSSCSKVSSVRPTTGHIVLRHNKESTLFDLIDGCVDDTLALLRKHYQDSNYEVVGVGFSSFVMNFIGLNDSGHPVGEEATLSYASNTPDVVKECQVLKRELGNQMVDELYQKTGAPIHSAYALAQLVSYYKTRGATTEDDQACHVKQWSSIASICLSRWIGMAPKLVPISFSEASWTGMFNFRTCEWECDCIHLLPEECQNALPKVADYASRPYFIEEYCVANSSKRIRNSYWDRWPELRGNNGERCRMFLGMGDGACANVGSKCTSTSRIAVTIGTSAAMRVCMPLPCRQHTDNATTSMLVDKFIVPRGLFCYRINQSYVLVGGALTDGGSIIEWLRNLMNLKYDDDFNSCLQKASHSYYVCGSQRETHNDKREPSRDRTGTGTTLSVIPFLGGERSVGFRGGASGSIIGLSRNTSSSDLMRACLESVVLRLHAIWMAMDLKEHISCVIASGNALECNDLWRQMLADCIQKPVIIDHSTREGTSRGVGILVGMEFFNTLRRENKSFAVEKLDVFDERSPNRERKDHWRIVQTLQDDSIQCIAPLWNTS